LATLNLSSTLAGEFELQPERGKSLDDYSDVTGINLNAIPYPAKLMDGDRVVPGPEKGSKITSPGSLKFSMRSAHSLSL
jgi:hypothetical protein